MSDFDFKNEFEEIKKEIQLLGQKLDLLLLKQPQDFREHKNNCVKCGLHLESVMGYVCSDFNCPTFFKVRSEVSQTRG